HHFRVVASPGTIFVSGDLGLFVLRCQEQEPIAWLRDAVADEGDLDYVLGKVRAAEDPREEFFASLATAYLEHLAGPAERGRRAAAIRLRLAAAGGLTDGPIGQRLWTDIYLAEADDPEVPACTDWSAPMLRLYYALRAFSRLLDAGEVPAQLLGRPWP